MHSSRMRTVRNSSRLLGGVPGTGGLPGPRGWDVLVLRGVPGPGGGTCPDTSPPVNRQTGVKT